MKKINILYYVVLLLIGLESAVYPMFRTALTTKIIHYMNPHVRQAFLQKKKLDNAAPDQSQNQEDMHTEIENQANSYDHIDLNDGYASVIGYAVIPVLSLTGIILGIILKFQDRKAEKIIKDAIPIDQNSEIYQVYQQVKADYGIQEDVPLLLSDSLPSGEHGFFTLATYVPLEKIVILNAKFIDILFKQEYKSRLIQTFAHELEHHRQYMGYSGSYHKKQGRLIEHGADAAAAGYFDCPHCLESFALTSYQEQEGQKGGISTKYGYFSASDYVPYLIRAQKEKKICKGHEKLLYQDQKDWGNRVLGYFGAPLTVFDTSEITLKDFLPNC